MKVPDWKLASATADGGPPRSLQGSTNECFPLPIVRKDTDWPWNWCFMAALKRLFARRLMQITNQAQRLSIGARETSMGKFGLATKCATVPSSFQLKAVKC